MSIVSLFCEIDDFFLEYEKMKSTPCLPEATRIDPRGRPRTLHPSEVMTVLIAFHQSGYRTFKHFYFKHVCVYWQAAFPRLVSYTRLVQLKKEVLRLLTFYLSTHTGTCRGISFVDSTRLRVCDNKRISFHKVFAEKVSERGKTSMGWFYGFKLHLIINDTGDILDVALTPGNRDDRSLRSVFMRRVTTSIWCWNCWVIATSAQRKIIWRSTSKPYYSLDNFGQVHTLFSRYV
ncbi:transposase [Candidatus Poribacteria bacterium]|nr:transposase [Candidatus Poribacteria bacterium]